MREVLETLAGVWRQLVSQRVRTLLTLLGLIVGVGTLVTLSSAVAGLGAYMQRGMQQASGDDVVSVSRRWDENSIQRSAPPLSAFDRRAIATDPDLAGSQTLIRYSKRVPWGVRWGDDIWVVGTTPAALDFYGLGVAKGRFIAQGDVFDRSPVAVIGPDAAKKILPGVGDPVGRQILVDGNRFEVIGLLSRKPPLGQGSFWTWEGSVVVPSTTFVDRIAHSEQVQEIVVKASPLQMDRGGLWRVVDTVKAIVLNRHDQVQNFRITDPKQNAQTRQITTLVAGGLEVAIAAVCLGVGGINLMNIMLVSALSRTREIGIRRALGATRSDILAMFLLESAALALVGGIIGVAAGTVLAWLLAKALQMAFGYWPYVFVPLPAIAGLVSSVLVGVVFGLYPAHRAANLPIIDCLRYE